MGKAAEVKANTKEAKKYFRQGKSYRWIMRKLGYKSVSPVQNLLKK